MSAIIHEVASLPDETITFTGSHAIAPEIRPPQQQRKIGGIRENDVKAEIWTPISTYLLVAIIKKRLGVELSFYTILQILSISIFEKTALTPLFSQSDHKTPTLPIHNQLLLFD